MLNQQMAETNFPDDLKSSSEVIQTTAVEASIEEMSAMDLVEQIRNAELPFLRESDLQRLPTLDRDTLVRLVYLARQHSVRNGERIHG